MLFVSPSVLDHYRTKAVFLSDLLNWMQASPPLRQNDGRNQDQKNCKSVRILVHFPSPSEIFPGRARPRPRDSRAQRAGTEGGESVAGLITPPTRHATARTRRFSYSSPARLPAGDDAPVDAVDDHT